MNRPILAAASAYLLWGLFPIYWKSLEAVPVLQIGAHRLVWCAVFVFGFLLLSAGWRWIPALLKQPKTLRLLLISASLIGANWWLYIWGVNNGHIVETSLGYFINPLVSVALGVLVLGERLRSAQWLAVALAAAGVLYMTLGFGRLPWIALWLAFSFGSYGLCRKLAAVDSVQGLAVENSVLLLPSLAIIGWAHSHGSGAFGNLGAGTDTLLVLSGLITAIPLVLFAYGARRIPLSQIGLLQYMAPTLQLICGVFLYDEAFTHTHAVGFSLIWTALAIYAAESLLWSRKKAPSTEKTPATSAA
ncbi:MAG: EamA family transporter RarD [Pseudomonadota bacterium]